MTKEINGKPFYQYEDIGLDRSGFVFNRDLIIDTLTLNEFQIYDDIMEDLKIDFAPLHGASYVKSVKESFNWKDIQKEYRDTKKSWTGSYRKEIAINSKARGDITFELRQYVPSKTSKSGYTRKPNIHILVIKRKILNEMLDFVNKRIVETASDSVSHLMIVPKIYYSHIEYQKITIFLNGEDKIWKL